jgi:ATP-dependent Zn protease
VKIKALLIGLLVPIMVFAQQTEEPPSRLVTALTTWLPFLFLIGLWWFFMRRVTPRGKGGYQEYLRVTQERVERIEVHLADIAASLRTIAAAAGDSKADRSDVT